MNRIVIFAIIAGWCSFAGNATAQQFNYNAIQWEPNPHTAALKARAESKAVMLHFTADWCGPCQNQKRFVFSSPEVVRAIHQNAVPVLVNIDTNKALAEELNVRSIPHDIFLTPDGEVIARRNSPTETTNFVNMCKSIKYQPNLNGDQHDSAIAQLKREMSPMNAPSGQRSNFGASGPNEVSSVGISNEARALAKRSNYGQMINNPNKGAFANQQQPANPKMELQNALAGLASDVSNASSKPRKSRFFEIPEKRLENPAAAYDPATNEFHPHRANEHFDRRAFLAKQRPEITVPRNAPAAKPIRITNNEFFRQANQAKLTSSQSMPGLEVSEMFDASSGKLINSETTGPSFARIQKENDNQPVGPTNEAKIIASSNARIQSYKEGEPKFAQQASMLKEQPAQVSTPPKNLTVNVAAEEDFALHGKCPVSLIQDGQWVEGNAQWGIVHRDRTYLFSSKEKYELFKTNPDRFSPILSGYDPVIFHEQGQLLDGLEENGVFMGKNEKQHIVLFKNQETRAKFQANPKLYLDSVRQAVYLASRNTNEVQAGIKDDNSPVVELR